MDNQNTNMEVFDDMTADERNEHNKIKRAVSESLLEALQMAESIKQAKLEEKGVKYLLEMIGKAIPIIVVALVSWICLTIVEVQRDIALTQKDILAMRSEIKEMGQHLIAHDEAEARRDEISSSIHHVNRDQKCNSCHEKTSINIFEKMNEDK